MTRDELITEFFKHHDRSLRWCDGGACACMGCINGSLRNAWWAYTNGNRTEITKEEFDRLSPPLIRQSETISFSFRSYDAPKLPVTHDDEVPFPAFQRDPQNDRPGYKAWTTAKLNKRSDQITLLEAYSKFLEDRGYLDTDWRTEAPYAIDEFLKNQKP